MKFNFSFINVHKRDAVLNSLHGLKPYMIQRFNNPLKTPPYDIFFMSNETENWLKEKLCVSSFFNIYREMGLIIPNWYKESEDRNSILAEEGRVFRAENFPTAEHLVFYPPRSPKAFFFSVRKEPEFIELDEIPNTLERFSYIVRSRIRKGYPVGIHQFFNYGDPYFSDTTIDKEGAFDLDLAAISVLLLFPNAEIIVDIDEDILYNTNYSGHFIEAVNSQLNKYE